MKTKPRAPSERKTKDVISQVPRPADTGEVRRPQNPPLRVHGGHSPDLSLSLSLSVSLLLSAWRANRFEDAHLVPRKREDEVHESESVVGYVALCEEKWRQLQTQAFNNTGLLNNIHTLVTRLHAYCSASTESWEEAERELGSLSELQGTIDSVSRAVAESLDEARRIEGALVGAARRRQDSEVEEVRSRAQQQLKRSEREFHENLDRLRRQHESFAEEVAESQKSYSATTRAADELRAKLAGTSGTQQYTNLDQVQLDIKIDQKFRVRDIE